MPLLALVPELPGQTLEVFDEVSAVQIALVDRDAIGQLNSEWDKAGIYLLLDPVATDGTWGVYVGKAPAGLKSRVKQQVIGKDSWNRAVLVRRDTSHGFNSAHVGWLEGHIHQLLTASALATPSNKLIPSDDSLAEWDLHALQMCATGVMRTLRLLGYEPAAPEDVQDAQPSYGKKHTSSTKLVDLIGAGLLKPDEELTSLNSLWPATAKVTESGKVHFNGEPYDYPSSAGSAVKGGGAVNGWEFWGVSRDEGLIPLSVIRAQYDNT